MKQFNGKPGGHVTETGEQEPTFATTSPCASQEGIKPNGPFGGIIGLSFIAAMRELELQQHRMFINAAMPMKLLRGS